MRFFADDRQMISDPCAMSRWKVIVRLRSHQRESIVIQRAILRIGASALAASVEGRGFKGEGYGRGLRERVGPAHQSWTPMTILSDPLGRLERFGADVAE